MEAQRHQRAREVFLAARERPDAERAAFVGAACAGDGELLALVESLLRHDERDTGGPPAGAAEPAALPPPERLGPYRVLSTLGEGGFGVVYLAEQEEPIRRRVALKVIRPGMDSRAVVARFEQERQALALMEHPNVARVLDAGATPEGRPYFVMEHVPGEPITAYCDRHRLTVRQRLELFAPVCEAVQHAHMKGIIHRDVKPSNILVAVRDGEPVPKVIDFGVAKAISHTLAAETAFTEQGQIIGTPEYMSPEQAEMGALDIDTRTDVYSLGVVLYELLAGAPPFEARTLRRAGWREVQRVIREVDPPRPSTRLTAMASSGQAQAAEGIAAARRTHLGELERELRRELEWVPLKAMRKDRTERYRTAQEMADDIRNYLAGRPLIAGPESARYRVRKFVRRNRGPVAAVAAVCLAVLLGTGGTLLALGRALRAEARAGEERDLAVAVTRFVETMLTGVDPRAREGRIDVRVLDLLSAAAAAVHAGEAPAQLRVEAEARRLIGTTYLAIGQWAEASDHLREAVRILRGLPGPARDASLAEALNAYAEACCETRQFGPAEEAAAEALAIARRLFPGDAPATARAQHLRGLVRDKSGRRAEAEPLYTEALEMRQRLWPRGSREVGESLFALGALRFELGDPLRGEQLLREALGVFERPGVQGPGMAYALQCREALATLLHSTGRVEQAETEMRAVLAGNKLLLGEDHPDVARNASSLAGICLALGRGDAEALFGEALGIYERAGLADSVEAAGTRQSLAQLRLGQGLYSEARDLLARAVSALEGRPGEEERLAAALHDLAWAHWYPGQREEAVAAMRRAEDLYRRRGEPTEAFGLTLRDGAFFDREMGRPEAAESGFREAVEVHRRAGEPAALQLTVSLRFLGENLIALERPAEAEPLLRECVALREQHLAAGTPGFAQWHIAAARSLLGSAIARQGRFEEAEPLLTAALEALRADGAPPREAQMALARVVDLYTRWGRPEQAERWQDTPPKPNDAPPR